MHNNILIIMYTNGAIYLQPGMTVGKLLTAAQALEDMVLGIEINPTNTDTPAEPTPPVQDSPVISQ